MGEVQSQRQCLWCNVLIEIKLDDENKRKPYNIDGTKHWCDRSGKAIPPLQPVTLDDVKQLVTEEVLSNQTEERIRLLIREELSKMLP